VPHEPGAGRHLEERILIRFPGLLAVFAPIVWRLPHRSRLRAALVRRVVRLGIEASNRRDHQAMFMLYAPDCESSFPPQMAAIGEPGARGREERVRWEARWRDEWGDFHYVPDELVDLGERLLITGRMRGTGRGSGVASDTDWAVLFDVAAGQAVRERVYFDRQPALEDAGLQR
jgi:ketosteroid isomerase-like protein